MTRATKAILLARVSDKRQDSEEAQLNNMRKFAASYGFRQENCDERKIKESSTKGDRKKFQEIIAEIKASKEPVALIVDTIDRLQRSFRESIVLDELRKEGRVELYFQRDNLVIKHNSNSSELMRWDMGVMFARNYVLQLGDNVKRTYELMRSEGQYPSKPPLGYASVYKKDEKDNRERVSIVPDSIRAPLLIQAYNLFATGKYSIKTLTTEMHKRGLTGKNEKPIAPSMLHYTLCNPFNKGEMRTKYGTMPHIHEPLVSKDLFAKVQKLLNAKKKNPAKHKSIDFIFGEGLLKCADPACGCVCSPEIKKGRLVYYACTNHKRIHAKRLYVREEVYLEPIYRVLEKLQLPQKKVDELVKALKKSIDSKSLYQKSEITRLRKIIDEEQVAQNAIAKKFARDEIGKDIYDSVISESKEKQRQAETELTNHADADENYFVNAGRVLDVARRASEIFKSSEVNEKRAFLRFLFQNINADGEKLLFTMRKPFDTLVLISEHPTWLPD